nr:MMPL family transporter [Methylomonas sp. SURF-2]
MLLLPVLLAVTLWQIRVESDLNAFFTHTNDADAELLSGLLQSGELSRRYLLVVEESAANARDAPSLAAFSAKLIQQLAQLDQVEQVWPAARPPRDWLDATQFYAPYHARIYSLNPARDAASLFDPQALPGRADGLRQALLSPQGGFVKSIAKQDPLLLSLNGFKTLQAGFQQTRDDGALILQSRPPALDSAAHAKLRAAIDARFDDLNQAAGRAFRLSIAGVPVFSVAARDEISRDVTLVSTASSLCVVLVFLLLFRSFSALHWLLLLQGCAFLIGILATQLIFGQVHSLTLALGASLIGICVDYPIHVMAHSAKHRSSPLHNARLLWPSLWLGGLTTVIGYAAMGFSGFPGFEQIAVFALFSIAASLGLTRWLLPALLRHGSLHIADLPGIAGWVAFCGRRRKALLSLIACAAVLAVFSLPRLGWMDDMQKLTMNMDAIKQQDATVRAHFSSMEPGRFVLIRADDFETALQRAEAAERRLQDLQRAGVVKSYHGLFPWLASQALQAENARVYNAALTAEFQDAWRAALDLAGLSADKLGRLTPAGSGELAPEAVLETPVRHVLSGQLLAERQGVALALWLGDHDPAGLAAGLQGLAGTRYFSQREQLNQLAGQYRDRSLRMLAIGIAVMGFLIWLQIRGLRNTLLTLLPSLAAVLFIFASWALLGEELSFVHVIGLLLSISLCVDYGIFFIENRGGDSEVTYHAIAASTLTTLASFGALGLGKTPTLPILSLSVSLGVVLGFLLCPLLIPKTDPA